MSLNFVSTTVLSSTDGVSHDTETRLESSSNHNNNTSTSENYKPLYEQLRQNAQEEQDKYDEITKALRGTRALDDEDVAHLQSVEDERNERLRLQVLKEKEELDYSNDPDNHIARKWLKDGQWPRKSKSFWEQLDEILPQIKYFEFTGGEPFMIQEHFDLLEKSVELGHAKQQEIHYNTNGTQFPDYAIKHIWPHFKDVEIAFSVDDIRGRFEYQRYGAKWDQVNENIRKFNELKCNTKNITTQICCTINIQNIYNLDNMADWMKQQNFDYVFYNYLHEAKEWNVQYLPIHIKQKIKKKLDAYDGDIWHYKQIQNAVNFMMSANLHTEEMLHKRRLKIRLSDQFRNESFAEIFPELRELV